MADERPPRLMIVPTAGDPRWPLLAFQLVLVVYALSFPGFGRRAAQFWASALTCVLFDAAVSWLRGGPFVLPLSGLNAAMGVVLLCDSPFVWPYAAVAALSMASKHFIRAEGRHLFVPSVFGMAAGLLFLSDSVAARPDRWGGTPWVLAFVVVYGIWMSARVRRLALSASYLAVFLAGVLARSAVSGKAALTLAAPMTGATFYLFAFFIMTDPITTPSTALGGVVFGAALGILDTLLRALEVRNSIFYAVFVCTSLMPFLRLLFPSREPERPWRVKAVALAAGAAARI